MKVLDPGHFYELDIYDDGSPQSLVFMKRQGEKYPGNDGAYGGTNCQDVIRVLIDRVKYLDQQERHPANREILASLRRALVGFECRAAQRHQRTINFPRTPENEPACRICGHWQCGCEERK